MVDYFAILHSYIPPDSETYAIYVPHVASVTAKALRIARRMGLSAAQQRFIEEAAMLHDIGIVNVDAPSMGCTGDLPYLAHLSEGRRILEQAGLPRHALVAERHVGVGIPRADVLAHDLPLPPRDFVPQTTEEQIISWADLFFRKLPGELWRELGIEEVRAQVSTYGPRAERVFASWRVKFYG